MNIKVSYKAKWQLKEHSNYKWTECKKLINLKTNREIKRTIKNNIAGYWINKKFIPFNNLQFMVELIPKQSTPF